MKVTIKNWMDEEDLRARLRVIWLSKELDFFDWEPEDNNLLRNFSDCFSIWKLLKEANELWLNWKVIEIEEVEDNNVFEY